MASRTEKPLSQVIEQRRDTLSFDGAPIPDADLKQILETGLKMPSGFKPFLAASSALINTLAEAPSENCEAFPAVTLLPSMICWPP